jgi:hypothetical protein
MQGEVKCREPKEKEYPGSARTKLYPTPKLSRSYELTRDHITQTRAAPARQQRC